MNTRQLGTTALQITLVGLGAGAIGGNGWLNGWGPQDDDDSIATIHQPTERGINGHPTTPTPQPPPNYQTHGRPLGPTR
ncbi:MAG: hypothetical protein SH847_15825 [Roseiflexaceae bacterium]|nr:hypothetical protein [Roseiflexaceae bacterium]